MEAERSAEEPATPPQLLLRPTVPILRSGFETCLAFLGADGNALSFQACPGKVFSAQFDKLMWKKKSPLFTSPGLNPRPVHDQQTTLHWTIRGLANLCWKELKLTIADHGNTRSWCVLTVICLHQNQKMLMSYEPLICQAQHTVTTCSIEPPSSPNCTISISKTMQLIGYKVLIACSN